MRQDSLLSHKRQHERLNTATSRESMDRESTAYAIYQLQYSGGAAPETQSSPYVNPDKPPDVLNTLLSAIDMESTGRPEGPSLQVQQQGVQQMSGTETVLVTTSAATVRQDDIASTSTAQQSKPDDDDDFEVIQFPDALSEVEVTSDNPPDRSVGKTDEAQNVMIVHSNPATTTDSNVQTVTFELQEQEDRVVLAEVQSSSPAMASNTQTTSGTIRSSTETSTKVTTAGEHSYPEIRTNTAYVQIVDPQSIPGTVSATQAQAATVNASLQGAQASPNTTIPQPVFNFQLPSQLVRGAVLPAMQQQDTIQLVTSGSGTSVSPDMIHVGQPITVASPSILMQRAASQQQLNRSGVVYTSKPTQQSETQSESTSIGSNRQQQQQTLVVPPGQQDISVPLTFALSQQQQQQAHILSAQGSGTRLEQVTFPQPAASVSSTSSTAAAIGQQQQPVHFQSNQSSPAIVLKPMGIPGQPRM